MRSTGRVAALGGARVGAGVGGIDADDLAGALGLAVGTIAGDVDLDRAARPRRMMSRVRAMSCGRTTSLSASVASRSVRSPGEIVVESRVGGRTIEALRRRGHRVTVAGPWSLARISAVSRDPETGMLHAAANPRGMQGYAVGR